MSQSIKERSYFLNCIFAAVTCGIYPIVFWHKLSNDVNTICEGDGKKTMRYVFVWMLNFVTAGIFGIVWRALLAKRLKENAARYGLKFSDSAVYTVLFTVFFGALGLFITKIVLVKNPVNPDIELWIGAIQRIYNAGIRKIGAIHRGFSTYGKHLYRNQPQWHIPIELRRRIPNLPIVCDPSHIGGLRELVAPISQQAMDMGFDGLIIESHCDPDNAWSDKTQQVTPDVLNFIVNMLIVRETSQTTENLNILRQQIDQIDNELIEILNKRMRVCREIGQYKKEHHMQVVQTGRYDDILRSRIKLAEEMGMSGDFMKTVLAAIHEESVRQQIEVLNGRKI